MSDTMKAVLDDLVAMSAELGAPANDYAIIGEGNTSVRADADTFWVKASGTQLARASRTGFVRLRFAPVLAALQQRQLDDSEVKAMLKSATIEGDRVPSIETFLHAICLQLEGVNFVGHTHPTVAVGLLCGQMSRECFRGNLFPDQIVVLGPALAYVNCRGPARTASAGPPSVFWPSPHTPELPPARAWCIADPVVEQMEGPVV